MLVLRRKQGEKIVIGDNIEVIFDNIDNHSIKVLVKAPKDVKIMRGELVDKEKVKRTQVA